MTEEKEFLIAQITQKAMLFAVSWVFNVPYRIDNLEREIKIL